MKILNTLQNRFRKDIAIDLGTANIRIMLKDSSEVIKEPCLVAINQNNGKIVAVGEEARKMIGRTPANIVAIQPLKYGVISDFNATQSIIHYYINKILETKFTKFSWINVIIAVPSLITEVEIKAVIDSAKSAGAKKVYIVEEPIAAAIGSGLEIEGSSGSMIIDIGGGTSDIAIISLGGIIVDNTIKVAGDTMDRAIQDYIKRKYNLMIGLKMAEDIKIKLSNALPSKDIESLDVKGQDLVNGLPKVIKISSLEINEALRPVFNQLINSIKEAIEKAPPEIVSDLITNGVTIAGGGALIKNLDKLFEEELGIKFNIPLEPIYSVSRGLQIILSEPKILNSVQFRDFILR